ncbi:MAG: hypothetical protein OXR66_06445 [Candidatus Woesearchaeota archaeon]|nr:hypothetical protein [Candidatus Woesearchaeota archaeon]
MKIGTICMKIAGRDAGKQCIIIEEPKDGKVLIEGAVRRRFCNLKHLEPMGSSKVKKGATHAAVMKELGLPERKSKPRKTAARPRKVRKAKVKTDVPKESPKKTPKPAEKEEKPAKKVEAKEEKQVKKAPKKD